MEFVGGEGGRRTGGAGRGAREMQLKERLRKEIQSKEKKPFRGGIDDETDVRAELLGACDWIRFARLLERRVCFWLDLLCSVLLCSVLICSTMF